MKNNKYKDDFFMKKVLILLAEGFEEIEALGTADILRRMGAEVVLAAMEKEKVSGSHNITVSADELFDKVDKSEFDAVVLPGGLPGSLNLYNDDRVIDILHNFLYEYNQNVNLTRITEYEDYIVKHICDS